MYSRRKQRKLFDSYIFYNRLPLSLFLQQMIRNIRVRSVKENRGEGCTTITTIQSQFIMTQKKHNVQKSNYNE